MLGGHLLRAASTRRCSTEPPQSLDLTKNEVVLAWRGLPLLGIWASGGWRQTRVEPHTPHVSRYWTTSRLGSRRYTDER